jgi:single-strand DNA-binding protein
MIAATVSGRLGRDGEIREAGGGKLVSFSVASNSWRKGEEIVTWIDCALWGPRAEKLAPLLRKGVAVVVRGALDLREHNGKRYLDLRADDVEIVRDGSRRPSSAQTPSLPPGNGENPPF